MADFTDSKLTGGITPPTPIVNPVEDRSGEIMAQGLSSFFGAIGGGIKQSMAASQKAAGDAVVNSYQQRALAIANAVEGGLSPQAGRMKLRALNSEFIANNPGLTSEINKVHGTILSTAGLGKVITTGNEQQEALIKGQQAALQEGWGPDLESAYNNRQAHLDARRQLERVTTSNETKKALRDGVIAESEWQGTRALHELARTSDPWFKGRIEQAEQMIAAGGDQAAIMSALEAEFNEQFSQVNQLKAMAGDGGVKIDYVIEPMKQRLQLFKDVQTGKISTELAAAEVARIDIQLQLMTRQENPRLAALVISSQLVGNQNTAIMEKIHAETMKMVQSNSFQPNIDAIMGTTYKPADVIDDGTATKQYLDMNAEALKKEQTPELQDDLSQHFSRIIEGVGLHAPTGNGPKDFRHVVEFFAKPEVGKFVKDNQGLSGEEKQKAAEAVQQYYGDELLPLVQERWEGVGASGLDNPAGGLNLSFGGMGGATRAPVEGVTASEGLVSDFVDVKFDGTGVTFSVKEGFENSPRARGIAKSLTEGNSSIGKPLNTYLRALSTLTGRSTEDIFTNDIGPRIFGLEAGTTEASQEAPQEAQATVTPEEATTPLSEAPIASEANPEVMEQFNKSLSPTDEKGEPNLSQFKTAPTGKESYIPDAETLPLTKPTSGLKLSYFNEDPEVATNQALDIINDTFVADPEGALGAKNRISIAKSFTGFSENDNEQNKAISAFIKQNTGVEINPAKTAWCAAFLNAIIAANGGEGTGKLNAKSFLDWGTKVDKPKKGDVVVFHRGDPTSWQGHVGIFMGYDDAGDIIVYGGNQSDAAKESVYAAGRVAGFRRG